MANPTSLERPKLVRFRVTNVRGRNAFSAWLLTSAGATRQKLTEDPNGNTLVLSSEGRGVVDMSWFTTWTTGDKLIIKVAGYAYGSGNIILTSTASGGQNIGTITGVTTALPGLSL